MKIKSVDLNEILAKELKDKEIKLLFDEHRFYLQIAHLIYDLRTKSGLTQIQLALKAQISQPMLARLEKGDRRRTPTLETIFKILKTMGYDLSINIQKTKRK